MRLLFLSTFALATVSITHGAVQDPSESTITAPPGKKLRGNRVQAVHTRVMHPYTTDEARKPENLVLDPLVDPHYPSNAQNQNADKIQLRGKSSSGEIREIKVHMDKLEPHVSHKSHLLHQHKHHDAIDHHDNAHVPHDSRHHSHTSTHYDDSTHNPLHDETKKIPSAKSAAQESHHHVHQQQPHYHPHQAKSAMKKMLSLPTARSEFYNETLFEALHNSPFEIYEQALGHTLEEGESFPVFTMPTWYKSTGVFSAFSKTATPLIFENSQVLLEWQDIVASSQGISPALKDFMTDSNFHASLLVAKSFGYQGVKSFLGLVLSYYQFGVEKHVLIPFAKVGDFFEESSYTQVSDGSIRNIQMSALENLLAQKESNSTNPHPILELRDSRKEELENLDAIRSQKLFQALIRRSYLFSFGYADCIRSSPYDLRECLDDAFSGVVKLETSVRGALDKELAEHFGQINESFHSRVSEACIMVQGSSGAGAFGSGSCYDFEDLRHFVHSTVL
jgi:hypothetical protein